MKQPRLRDIDGTVYDPDTGLPVARKTQDQTGETKAREISAHGLARFKRDFESLSNAIMGKRIKDDGTEIAVGELDLTPMEQQVNKELNAVRNATRICSETHYQMELGAEGSDGAPFITGVTHRILREVRGVPMMFNCDKPVNEPWAVTIDWPPFNVRIVAVDDDLENAIATAEEMVGNELDARQKGVIEKDDGKAEL